MGQHLSCAPFNTGYTRTASVVGLCRSRAAAHNQYAVRVMIRAVAFISARATAGSAAPPALSALCPCRSSSALICCTIARVRASVCGKRCRCPSRCSTTCRSVSATKPRLVRSPASPASAPIANEPAYQTGFEQAGATAQLLDAARAPGEMVGFLAAPPRRAPPGWRGSTPLPPVPGTGPGQPLRRSDSPASARQRAGARTAFRPFRRCLRPGRAGSPSCRRAGFAGPGRSARSGGRWGCSGGPAGAPWGSIGAHLYMWLLVPVARSPARVCKGRGRPLDLPAFSPRA